MGRDSGCLLSLGSVGACIELLCIFTLQEVQGVQQMHVCWVCCQPVATVALQSWPVVLLQLVVALRCI